MASKQEQKTTDGKVTAKRFAQMTAGEKVVHVCKVIVFFLSFGFAYPNILGD